MSDSNESAFRAAVSKLQLVSGSEERPDAQVCWALFAAQAYPIDRTMDSRL
jgi:hypothetical protein